MKHEEWPEDLASLGIELDSVAWERICGYHELLRRLAVPRGMIAAGDAERLWERHILDGLRGVVEIHDGERVADIGSGAGIPGVPLAIARPDCGFTLIEPRRGRVSFLESVVDRLELRNVRVFLGRVNEVEADFDVAVARAFASALGSWEAALGVLGHPGRLIYWAGSSTDLSDLDSQGVSFRLSTLSTLTGLADAGPLVIMGRQ